MQGTPSISTVMSGQPRYEISVDADDIMEEEEIQESIGGMK